MLSQKDLNTDLEVLCLKGPDAAKYARQIADIRIDLFKEYPYLYDGSYEYEKAYLDLYFKSENSLIILIFDGEKLVGFSSSLPLSEEMPELQEPFKDTLEDYLYVGEVMLCPGYRRLGFLNFFVKEHKAWAKKRGFSKLLFMTVDRPDTHPCRPKGYKPLDLMWRHLGAKRLEDKTISLPWVQVDTQKEELNTLSLWTKDLTL